MPLRGYDYAQPGYYFVIIGTQNMRCVFGYGENGKIHLNSWGRAVKKCWFDLPNHYPSTLDAFVVMPNHVHGIIVLSDDVLPKFFYPNAPVGLNPPVRAKNVYPLTEIVRGFKSFSAAEINILRNAKGASLWRRSFHDHILRTHRDIENVREYIRLNPLKWQLDSKNLHSRVYYPNET